MLLTILLTCPAYAVDIVTHYATPSGYYHGEPGTYTWIDYCPLCGCHDCLLWNPKGTYEGEWTCMVCNADFDGTNGYDKAGCGARGRLTRYVPEPIDNLTATNMTTNTTTPPLTGWDLAHHTYQNNQII